MVKVYQAKPLTMEWCINCHKNPTPYLRDPANVTKMGYDDPKAMPHRTHDEGVKFAQKNQIMIPNPDGKLVIGAPTNCSTCHR